MKRKKVRKIIGEVRRRERQKVIKECLAEHKKEIRKLNREHLLKIKALKEDVTLAQRRRDNALRAFRIFKADRRKVIRFIEDYQPEIEEGLCQLAGLMHVFNKIKFLDYKNKLKDITVQNKFNK